MPRPVVNDADVYTYGPQLRLDPQGATPPTAAYISADNQIGFFTSTTALAFTLTAIARILLPDGTVSLNQYAFLIPNTRAATLTQWNLPEGFLLSISVYANAGSDRRQVFCQVNLLQTGQTPPILTAVLCAGYLSPVVPISFPVGVNQNNIDCYGSVKVFNTTIPGAGSNISEQVPANTRWRLISLTFDLITSAAVANRDVFVQISEGPTIYFSVLANTATQTAGLTWHYEIAAGMAQVTAVAQGYVSAPLPTFMFIRFPGAFSTSIRGLQAGDLIANGAYLAEEWLCP
jgi:hypothetical protein